MSDPKRLLDDPATSAQLRADLQRVAEASPTYDASAGLAALQNAIGQGAPAGVGGAAGHASLAKLSIAGGVAATLAAGVIAVVVMRAPAPDSAAVQPRPMAPAAPIPVPTPVPVPEELSPPAAPEELPDPTTPRPAKSANEREIAQLARIKAVINDDPRLALQLAQQGHREFGRGLLRPEREGLAIVALYALERRAEADERARAYLAAHPKGVLAERVRALSGGRAP